MNIVLDKSDDTAKYELFQRLNTGGSKAVDQEVRNALLLMNNPEFLEWMEELSKNEDFRNCVPMSDRNFAALAVKNSILRAFESKKSSIHEDMVKKIIQLLNEPVSAHTRNLIDAESNLSFKTLKEVFRSIGLDFSSFWETRGQFIDQNMVKLRNEIAHGEMRPVTREEYDELKEFIQTALDRCAISFGDGSWPFSTSGRVLVIS